MEQNLRNKRENGYQASIRSRVKLPRPSPESGHPQGWEESVYVPHLLFREPVQGVPHYKRGVNRPDSLKEVTPEGRTPARLAQGVVSGTAAVKNAFGGVLPTSCPRGGGAATGGGDVPQGCECRHLYLPLPWVISDN